VSVVVAIDSSTGKLLSGPEIHARGAGIESFQPVIPRLEEVLEKAAADGVNDAYQLRQLVRRTAGRWVNENFGRRPMIIPVIVEV
jgi:ribonuclease J